MLYVQIRPGSAYNKKLITSHTSQFSWGHNICWLVTRRYYVGGACGDLSMVAAVHSLHTSAACVSVILILSQLVSYGDFQQTYEQEHFHDKASWFLLGCWHCALRTFNPCCAWIFCIYNSSCMYILPSMKILDHCCRTSVLLSTHQGQVFPGYSSSSSY